MTMRKFALKLAVATLGVVAAGAVAIGEECAEKTTSSSLVNDYPTFARADYVYGCMMVNGQGRDILEKCACSIDVIASALPYKEYEESETIMSVRQRGGESVAYMYAPAMLEKIKNLKRAQVEGEIRCF